MVFWALLFVTIWWYGVEAGNCGKMFNARFVFVMEDSVWSIPMVIERGEVPSSSHTNNTTYD